MEILPALRIGLTVQFLADFIGDDDGNNQRDYEYPDHTIAP